MRFVVLLTAAVIAFPMSARAQVTLYEDDYEGFLDDAGGVSTIDFETLPNGEPSEPGVEITEDFNYDLQGAHFSAPAGTPVIAGNPETGFDLFVIDSEDTWLIGDLSTPATALGIFFHGTTTLSIFGEDDTLLGEHTFGGCCESRFIGFVSDLPIAYATMDSGSNTETIDSFILAPVPEPGTLVLVSLAGSALLSRRRRRGSSTHTTSRSPRRRTTSVRRTPSPTAR